MRRRETVKGNIEFSTTSDSAVDDKVDLFPGGCLFISSGARAYGPDDTPPPAPRCSPRVASHSA